FRLFDLLQIEKSAERADALQLRSCLYDSRKQHDAAEADLRNAMAMTKDLFGTNNLNYADALQLLGVFLFDHGRTEGLGVLKESIEIRKRLQEPTDPTYLQANFYLARTLNKDGQYREAEFLLRTLLEHTLVYNGKKNIVYVNAENELLVSLRHQAEKAESEAQFEKAIRLRNEVLEISTERFGTDHWTSQDAQRAVKQLHHLQTLTPDALKQVALAREMFQHVRELDRQKNYSEAIDKSQKALEIWKEHIGEENQVFASELGWLAREYRLMEQYSKASEHLARSTEITRRVLGTEHREYDYRLEHLCVLYRTEGQYQKARKMAEELIAVRSKLVGKTASQTNNAHLMLSTVLEYQTEEAIESGRWKEADETIKQAADHYRLARGEQTAKFRTLNAHANYIGLVAALTSEQQRSHDRFRKLLTLSETMIQDEKYGPALSQLQPALRDVEQMIGTENEIYAEAKSWEGWALMELGQLDAAQTAMTSALTATEKSFGKSHEKYANQLHELGQLAAKRNDWKANVEHLTIAAGIARALSGSNGVSYKAIRSDLTAGLERLTQTSAGGTKKSQMDFATANDAAARLVKLREEEFGAGDYRVRDAEILAKQVKMIESLTQEQLEEFAEFEALKRSESLIDEYRFEEAILALHDELALIDKLFGKKNTQVSHLLNGMGHLYWRAGNLPRAGSCFRDHFKLERELYGRRHPQVAKTIRTLGRICEEQGDETFAFQFAREAFSIEEALSPENNLSKVERICALAFAHYRLADYETARTRFEEAATILAQLDQPPNDVQIRILHNRACCERYLGELAE
ncbi:MAG: tetratricopeptide repeat protein, partial [Planctomycetaceae bacterium]|nr:tetratricopeptide repeat protein [Planctomycetaceae bacterium]